MAAANDQQPAFDVVAGAMNDISRSYVILATYIERIPNILALDGGLRAPMIPTVRTISV
jgi:hypothetical protein